jgi:preprotein translocase subunit SecE
VVIAAVFLFAAYFYAVDFVVGSGINSIIHKLSR